MSRKNEARNPGLYLSPATLYSSNIELRGLSWGLRGLVIFVDQSRDDGFSADRSQIGRVPDGGTRFATAAGVARYLFTADPPHRDLMPQDQDLDVLL
jgi:hypothetical protein